MTEEDETDISGWLTRLCVRHNVTDMPALMATEAFKTAYAEVQAKAPKLSAQSLTVKAFEHMSFVEQQTAVLNAHVLEVPAINYRYDEAQKESVPDEVGIRIVTPLGRPMFVKYGGYDPLKKREENVAKANLPPVVQGGTCQLTNVKVAEDLRLNTMSVRLGEGSKVVPGGHSEAFPDGLDLDGALGPLARKKGWGAFKRDKTRGVFKGKFGDREGSQTIFFGTTGKPDENRVRDYADDPLDPEDPHVLQAVVTDRNGLVTSTKIPIGAVKDKLGLSPGASKEAVLSRASNQRILLGGYGNIYASMNGDELFGPGQGIAIAKNLEEKGLLTVVGKNSLRRLNLRNLPKTYDANGKPIEPDFYQIGDKQVYDVEEKRDGTWEYSVLAESVGRKPWFTLKQGNKKDDEGNVIGKRNAESFFLFLDTVDGGSEVPADDPLMQAILALKLVPTNGGLPSPAMPIAKLT